MNHKKTAVILFNLGGPDSLQSVRPFLFNLFSDKAIISWPQPFRLALAWLISTLREKKARAIYEALGGKSPLSYITMHQALLLEKKLMQLGNFKTFVAMRYWQPLASEVVEEVKKFEPTNIILMPLYPQFSSATTKSSIHDFLKNFFSTSGIDKNISVKVVCCYPVDSNFIQAHANLIKQAVYSQLSPELFKKARFLFSAHGLPMKIIDAGDPYVFQVQATTAEIVKNLENDFKKKIDFKICYQSKVGVMPWTSPSLKYEIERVALDGKIPVIIPLSFVSDNSETLYELDIEYQEYAKSFGIEKYLRIPALNFDEHFIEGLKKICDQLDSNDDPGTKSNFFSGGKMLRICPKEYKLCINPNPCEA